MTASEPNQPTARLAAIAVGLLAGAALLLHARTYPLLTYDDAFISLRYSQRLLEGHGLTWTDGPPVEGYSNLLWVLGCALLGALGVKLDANVAASLDASARLYPNARQLVSRFAPVLRTALAVGLGLTFVLTAIAAYLLARRTARRVSRPVTELADSADRLAAGDLGHRADLRADGEVGELVDSFNRMGERPQSPRARLARAERIAAWRDAARRVAHEIKNPLTPMRIAIHRLRKRVPDDPDTTGCLDAITGVPVEKLFWPRFAKRLPVKTAGHAKSCDVSQEPWRPLAWPPMSKCLLRNAKAKSCVSWPLG